MSKAKHTIKVQVEQGIPAANLIYEAFVNRRGVFEDTSDLLEYQRPDGVQPRSSAHANFLFFLISQDHGVKSRRLYARARDLYGHEPWLFNPRDISSRFETETDPGLKALTADRLGTRYPRATAKQWFLNSKRLVSDYDGDARAIFSKSSDSLEAMQRIREFHGFGPKTGGLLFRTFFGCGFFDLPGKDKIPIPVDIHDTRIAALVGLIDITPSPKGGITTENYSTFAKAAQAGWIEVCERAGLDWLVLDRALWILGSRGCSPERYFNCCLTQNCMLGRSPKRGYLRKRQS